MLRYPFAFEAPVERLDFGRVAYNAVFVPKPVLKLLPLSQIPRLRMDAEVGGLLINCALMASKRGRYILLSAAFLRQAGLRVGQTVEVRFRIADQDSVEVPADLERAIQRHPRVRAVWETLTSGRRRGLAHRVASAVRPETREQRILEVLEDILEFRRRRQSTTETGSVDGPPANCGRSSEGNQTPIESSACSSC